ncbi:development-specific protein LVN1.2-like isoform X2 [Patiria miniata]|uniref:Uncharacterized protein n=1 Tax=Patiria miniata TaxID=46514 RepID=A0A914A5G0_PATMI|nr:development-specific protein LVN1.2-like isoform X2 [Patiria miniata]
MALKLVAFLLLVALATSYAEVKPCCYPDQYEISTGTQAGLSHQGHGTGYSVHSTSAVDALDKKVGERGTFYAEDGTPYEFQTIKDYGMGVEYKIDPTHMHCETVKLEGTMTTCVGDNATYSSSSYLGNNALTIDCFIYFFNYVGYVVGQQTVSVTQGDCLPTSYSFSGSLGGGKDKTDILTTTGFYNYVASISDPSKYFEVPDYCALDKAKSSEMWDMLRYKDIPFKF